MPHRRRPRIIQQALEQARQQDYAYALAHRDDLKIRLMAEFSADELAALRSKVAGYVASGQCRDIVV